MSEPTPPRVVIQVFQHDWIPGFAAFHPNGRIAKNAPAHVVLNLGSLIAAVHTGDLDKRDLPYMIAESLMHEVVHVLESWANVEFSEDRVEELLAKYRAKYSRATIWEYTGAEPKEATDTPAPDELAALRLRVEELTHERDQRNARLAEIHRQWGHVEGKEGCQCPICQKDFEAFMDVFEEYDMELHLPGGFKERAEKAERELGEARQALRLILMDLPVKRDWLDPNAERIARKIAGASSGHEPMRVDGPNEK